MTLTSLYDYLLKRDWLASAEARAKIAGRILRGDMRAEIRYVPAPPPGASYQDKIRFALNEANSRPKVISVLESPSARATLDAMALGNRPDLAMLKTINVNDDEAATQSLDSSNTKAKPVQRQDMDTILQELRSRNYTPEALPAIKNGKRGVRADIKSHLVDKKGMKDSSFKHAWQKLLDEGEIQTMKP